jgi:hypothetical protein
LPKIYSRDSASKSRDDDYRFGKILFDRYDDESSQDMKNGLIYQPQEERDKVLKYQQASMVDSESQIVFNEKKSKISCLEAGFCLEEHIFKGGHGEVWRAFKPNQPNQSYILKRMHVRNKPDILRCALREIFFGTQLREELPDNVAKYETYFILNDDYWLVYIDEGKKDVIYPHIFYYVMEWFNINIFSFLRGISAANTLCSDTYGVDCDIGAFSYLETHQDHKGRTRNVAIYYACYYIECCQITLYRDIA